MKPLKRFSALLLFGWVLAWLPIGLWVGDPDFVLTSVSRNTPERELYQLFLYMVLVTIFVVSWKLLRPQGVGWGHPKIFGAYFSLGLASAGSLLWGLSLLDMVVWELVIPSPFLTAKLLISCLLVALTEEALFRGILLGHLSGVLGETKAAVLGSLIFAWLHLFRPGTWSFKCGYGFGLFLLAYFLSMIFYHHRSILASAGFHAGVIVLNFFLEKREFQESFWAGWSGEPLSGAVCWGLVLAWGALWLRYRTYD